jgi:hypothetical protein
MTVVAVFVKPLHGVHLPSNGTAKPGPMKVVPPWPNPPLVAMQRFDAAKPDAGISSASSKESCDFTRNIGFPPPESQIAERNNTTGEIGKDRQKTTREGEDLLWSLRGCGRGYQALEMAIRALGSFSAAGSGQACQRKDLQEVLEVQLMKNRDYAQNPSMSASYEKVIKVKADVAALLTFLVLCGFRHISAEHFALGSLRSDDWQLARPTAPPLSSWEGSETQFS